MPLVGTGRIRTGLLQVLEDRPQKIDAAHIALGPPPAQPRGDHTPFATERQAEGALGPQARLGSVVAKAKNVGHGGRVSRPAVLKPGHDLSHFDCGRDQITNWLKQRARKAAESDTARTYVVCRGTKRVVGFFSVAAGAVAHAVTPSNTISGTIVLTGRYIRCPPLAMLQDTPTVGRSHAQ